MTQPTLDVRALSIGQLADLGSETMAYVRPVLIAGESAFALYCADGRRLAVMRDRREALELARQHGLDPVTVH